VEGQEGAGRRRKRRDRRGKREESHQNVVEVQPKV
jgi:hypothetical protein